MKTIIQRTAKYAKITAFGLTLGLLTACGGSSSKGDKVTTLPNCPVNSYYYNSSTDQFQFSQSDTRECQLLNTTSANCTTNETNVRVPVNTNINGNTGSSCSTINGIQNCSQQQVGTTFISNPVSNNSFNNFNNTGVSSNYYETQGQYQEVCVGQNDQNYRFIIYGANNNRSYNWLDVNSLNNAWNSSVSYHGSIGGALNSHDLPSWVLPVLGAGAGGLIGHSIDDNNGAIIGGVLGLGLGIIFN